MGRPSNLTEELGRSIIADVRRGLFLTQIALNNDCHPNTIRNWLRRGISPDAEEPFASFARSYIKAEAGVEAEVVEDVRLAAKEQTEIEKGTKTVTDAEGNTSEEETQRERVKPGDWRAAAWFAERRWPKRWGPAAADSAQREALNIIEILDDEASRGQDLDQLLESPPPELEEALLRHKDRLLALLGGGTGEPEAPPGKPAP